MAISFHFSHRVLLPFGFKLSIAVVILAVFYCFLKQLADDAGTEHEPIRRQDATARETEPILPRKEVFFSYGATGEQPESSVCPAEDSDSDKMCKICYDAPRSCFFIPCGHCFTCFTCARRYVSHIFSRRYVLSSLDFFSPLILLTYCC